MLQLGKQGQTFWKQHRHHCSEPGFPGWPHLRNELNTVQSLVRTALENQQHIRWNLSWRYLCSNLAFSFPRWWVLSKCLSFRKVQLTPLSPLNIWNFWKKIWRKCLAYQMPIPFLILLHLLWEKENPLVFFSPCLSDFVLLFWFSRVYEGLREKSVSVKDAKIWSFLCH